jgi:hypothetical protein
VDRDQILKGFGRVVEFFVFRMTENMLTVKTVLVFSCSPGSS